MVQLVITFGMVALFVYVDSANKLAKGNPALLWGSLIVTFVVMMAMACCTSLRRQAPMNFIFLGIFTLAEGLLLGVFSSNMKGEIVSFQSKKPYLNK